MTLRPRTRTSPSSAIFTSTPGIGLPTAPYSFAESRLTEITGEVSVRP